MIELIALGWLYLVGLLIMRRLQDFTSGRQEYGMWFWPMLLAWPVIAPVSWFLSRRR